MKKNRGIDITIIVVNYNGRKFIGKCLRSLKSQTYKNFEVLIVDNESADDSVSYIKEKFPEFPIILSSNQGFGHACNLGSKNAKGRYLMFFSEDDFVEKDFLEKFKEDYKNIKDPLHVGSIGCNIYNYEKKPWTKKTFYGYAIDLMSSPHINYEPKKIFHNTGNPFFVRKDVFKRVGGFCKNIFLYSEDIDLCWRMSLYGYKHYFFTDIKLYHYGGGVIGGFSIKKLSYYIKGELNCILNNYSLPFAIVALLYLCIFYLCLTLYYLIKGKVSYSLSILKTIISELSPSKLSKILEFRKSVQSKRKVSDWELLNKISLVPSRVLGIYYFFKYEKK